MVQFVTLTNEILGLERKGYVVIQNIPFLIHSVCTYVLTFVLAHNTTPGKSIFMLQHKKYLLILVFCLRNAGSCICLFLFVFKYSVQIESYKQTVFV